MEGVPTPREENFRFDGPRNFGLKETPFKNQGDGKMCVFFQRACSKEIYVIVTERGLEQLQQLQQRKHVKCTCDRFLQGCSPESCRAAIIVFLREWFFSLPELILILEVRRNEQSLMQKEERSD
jgi:hypothetical protein